MGKWAALVDISQELREDMPDMADDLAARMTRESAEQQGYHPVGEPVLTWTEVTQMEVEIQMSALGAAMNRAGDWHVRGVIEVTEETEI